MLVAFGTHVRDRDGKSVGTVSRLVLHPESRQVVEKLERGVTGELGKAPAA